MEQIEIYRCRLHTILPTIIEESEEEEETTEKVMGKKDAPPEATLLDEKKDDFLIEYPQMLIRIFTIGPSSCEESDGDESEEESEEENEEQTHDRADHSEVAEGGQENNDSLLQRM